jgi:hypothetical protein|tara:strand:+ start:30127 stop:30399 length:273 start_codon:yes stop_codon:yes gene_type:complete
MSHPFKPNTGAIKVDDTRQIKTVNGCSFNITWPQLPLGADRETLARFLNRFGHCEVVDAPEEKRHWAQEFAQKFNENRQPNMAQPCGGAL